MRPVSHAPRRPRRAKKGREDVGARSSRSATPTAISYMILAAQSIVTSFLATFKAFPPRQKAASFTIDQAVEKRARWRAAPHH
jgi:hypothetical protein